MHKQRPPIRYSPANLGTSAGDDTLNKLGGSMCPCPRAYIRRFRAKVVTWNWPQLSTARSSRNHPLLTSQSLAKITSFIKYQDVHIMWVTILRIFLWYFYIFSRMGSCENLHSQSIWRWKSWFPSKFLPTEPIHWSSVNQCLVVKTIFGFHPIDS